MTQLASLHHLTRPLRAIARFGAVCAGRVGINPITSDSTPRRVREAGRVTAATPLLGLAVLICAGIGIDFSGQTQAEQEMRDWIGSCGRRGATTATMSASAGQNYAVSITQQCLQEIGITADVTTSGDHLVIDARGTYTTKLLSIIMINELPITGHVEVELLQIQ